MSEDAGDGGEGDDAERGGTSTDDGATTGDEAADGPNGASEPGDATPEEPAAGTFLVTAVDDASAVLRDVERGRVHTVTDPPADLAVGEGVVGRLEPVPPMGVRWRLADVEDRFAISVTESDEPPTAHERSLAPDAVGDLVRRERAGEGELHVLRVPEDRTDAAVGDVLADETELRERAARLGVARVEVRSEPGVVCVRYLP
ncbi:MAG: DUF5812 family protein [Haloferacaceae archaeon]